MGIYRREEEFYAGYEGINFFYAPVVCLSKVHTVPESCSVFSSIFSSLACTPMDNYGCIWNSFEAKDGWLDTVQYALHAGGQGFDSLHLHHFRHQSAEFQLGKPPLIAACFFAQKAIQSDSKPEY